MNEQEIDNILNAFDGMQPAETPPFFYTRLQAKMEKKTSGNGVLSLLTNPVFAIATVLLFLVVNGYILFQQNNQPQILGNQKVSVADFAADYQLSTTTAYELNK